MSAFTCSLCTGVTTHCLECNSATQCTLCSVGYAGSICSICAIGYIGPTCSDCDTGFFPQNDLCKPCTIVSPHCRTCTMASFCGQCAIGYSGELCEQCSMGYFNSTGDLNSTGYFNFLNSTAQNSTLDSSAFTCSICTVISPHCQQCFNSTFCNICDIGYLTPSC